LKVEAHPTLKLKLKIEIGNDKRKPPGTTGSFFVCAPKTFADSKYVPVRVPQVHLADVPWHVSGWESDVQPGSHALSVDLVNVVHPDGHPHAFVGRFVSAWSKRGGVRASATATLASQAKKDLAFA